MFHDDKNYTPHPLSQTCRTNLRPSLECLNIFMTSLCGCDVVLTCIFQVEKLETFSCPPPSTFKKIGAPLKLSKIFHVRLPQFQPPWP